MDTQETVLNEEELDNDAVEDAEEEVETEDVGDDADDEFEYDEEGNIIIPDVIEDEEDEEFSEDSDEEIDSDDESDPEKNESSEETSDTEEIQTEEETKRESLTPDPRDERIAELEKQLAKLESQGRDTLKSLGADSDDVLKGLAAIAAEAQGKSPEEYGRKREAEELAATTQKLLRDQQFEIRARQDLAELHAAYPETQKYKHVRDLPQDIRKRFGEFRDMGLSAKQAYAAANPDGIRTDTAAAVKKQVAHGSKEHLRSAVPKASKSDSIAMSKKELAEFRELFPGMSDSELRALYKQSL